MLITVKAPMLRNCNTSSIVIFLFNFMVSFIVVPRSYGALQVVWSGSTNSSEISL